ncbi:hypothetical protein [Actinomadura fibrosa]|uniref:Uncharacterized protein n=1 Tax=Actinomadura fibrosa TaxID=111802 RepID=A0ABW2XRV1_9ACTN
MDSGTYRRPPGTAGAGAAVGCAGFGRGTRGAVPPGVPHSGAAVRDGTGRGAAPLGEGRVVGGAEGRAVGRAGAGRAGRGVVTRDGAGLGVRVGTGTALRVGVGRPGTGRVDGRAGTGRASGGRVAGGRALVGVGRTRVGAGRGAAPLGEGVAVGAGGRGRGVHDGPSGEAAADGVRCESAPCAATGFACVGVPVPAASQIPPARRPVPPSPASRTAGPRLMRPLSIM